jgi:hypothetical protein
MSSDRPPCERQRTGQAKGQGQAKAVERVLRAPLLPYVLQHMVSDPSFCWSWLAGAARVSRIWAATVADECLWLLICREQANITSPPPAATPGRGGGQAHDPLSLGAAGRSSAEQSEVSYRALARARELWARRVWDAWDAISSADREPVSRAGMITRGHCHDDGTTVPWFQAAPFVRRVTSHDAIAPRLTNTLHVLVPPSGTGMEFIGRSGTSLGEIDFTESHGASHGAITSRVMDQMNLQGTLELRPLREEVMGSIASGTSFVAPVTISSGDEWVTFYRLDATATPRAVAWLANRRAGCTFSVLRLGVPFGAPVPAGAQLLTGPIIIRQAAAAVATSQPRWLPGTTQPRLPGSQPVADDFPSSQPWLRMTFATGAIAGEVVGYHGAIRLRSHSGPDI